MDRRISEITMKMINYDKGDAARIHHFMKVHNFSKVIGEMEGLDSETQFILEAAAVLHDIGINKLWKSELNLAVKLGFSRQSAAHIPRENGGTHERNAEV